MLTSLVHMQGFPGKFYCPRMATMNKPAYAAIQASSPLLPTPLPDFFVRHADMTR